MQQRDLFSQIKIARNLQRKILHNFIVFLKDIEKIGETRQ